MQRRGGGLSAGVARARVHFALSLCTMPLSKCTAAPSRLRRTADDAFRASVLDCLTYTHRVKCMGVQLASQIDAVLYVDIVGSDEVVALLHEHFHMDSDGTPCSLVATSSNSRRSAARSRRRPLGFPTDFIGAQAMSRDQSRVDSMQAPA